MTFSEFIHALVDWFGMATMASLIVLFGGWFIQYMTKVIRKQTKIKWLCHHIYEKEWETEYVNNSFLYKTDYDLKCRKCGKTKCITIYHREGDDEHE